jgi:hypothetical protein
LRLGLAWALLPSSAAFQLIQMVPVCLPFIRQRHLILLDILDLLIQSSLEFEILDVATHIISEPLDVLMLVQLTLVVHVA